ncbi:integrin beta-7 isoform X1 [Prionailurus iriomotensis]
MPRSHPHRRSQNGGILICPCRGPASRPPPARNASSHTQVVPGASNW